MKERDLAGKRLTTALPKFRGVGRPKKFESVDELEEKIEAYFASCFIASTEEYKAWIEPDEGEEEGSRGRFEYGRRPLKDAAGNQVYELIQQPTITGLAVALDTTRDLLLDYENKPENAAFSDTIKRAKALIHKYAEDYLHDGKNQTGAIFSLKNNFGWNDRTELDLSTKGKALPASVITEKAAAILRKDNDAPPDDAAGA
jgi:hypothetical protein